MRKENKLPEKVNRNNALDTLKKTRTILKNSIETIDGIIEEEKVFMDLVNELEMKSDLKEIAPSLNLVPIPTEKPRGKLRVISPSTLMCPQR